MGQTNTEHETLVAGIRIESKEDVGGTFRNYGGGTLTGLATRNADNKKVLVTNLHVMTGPTKGSACQQGVDMNRTNVLISSVSADEVLQQDQRIRR